MQPTDNTRYTKSPPEDLGVFRVGFGYDMHRLVKGRDFWMGGIKIDFEKGLQGHSDADVLIHAICDALLGAANLRDIGFHFPDTAGEFHNIDSKVLLKKSIVLLREKGFEVGNIDTTICAEYPKMNPHIPAMQKVLSEIMETDIDNISIKATTSEKMGFVGRQEGITAYAVALIYKL
ncbi:MAG: 2-C-methyl-D-erythritol 2,4-cyclodiphosphate synthase [Bacteroidia bacterium]|nr:2-C-methyl-D-erythritol 2,4-cyclodiphosphate synthase [Bacteroidia bacterium]